MDAILKTVNGSDFMKAKIFIVVGLVACLCLCSCSGKGRSSSESNGSSDLSTQIEKNSSENISEDTVMYSDGIIEKAEVVLMDIYKPMILQFPEQINPQNPISAEDAYHCFQCYAICQFTAQNEEYDSWVIEGENVYDLYYDEDVVEAFIESYFKIPAETMRKTNDYVPDRNGYRLSVYSGKDQSVLNIIDRMYEGDLCTFSFTYSGADYMEAGECILSLREYEDGFYLEEFEGDVPEQ